MTTTVHKFALPMADAPRVSMPRGAEVLTVQVQGGPTPEQVFLWARVNPDAPMEERPFRVSGTGHALGEGVGRYVGTFQLHAGLLVFHVFEGLCA